MKHVDVQLVDVEVRPGRVLLYSHPLHSDKFPLDSFGSAGQYGDVVGPRAPAGGALDVRDAVLDVAVADSGLRMHGCDVSWESNGVCWFYAQMNIFTLSFIKIQYFVLKVP